MKNINLLYCFDEGYNLQTYASIYSISKNLKNCKLSIYIIHKNPNTFEDYLNKINNFENVDLVSIYQFEKDLSDYPFLKDSHVSEATYYRLFISEYLPNSLEHIIYLDSDVFCINNPQFMISYTVKNLLDSQHTISVATEMYKNSSDSDIFTKLQLKNERYFNAGVMIIDYQKWQKSVKILELVQLLENNSQKINNWDQDLLNIYFDGDYLELTNFLNFRIYYPIPIHFFENYSLFIHFAGNHKPWTIEGSLDEVSKIYFDLLDELVVNKFDLKIKSRRLTVFIFVLKNFLKLIKNRTNRKLLKVIIKTIFKKNIDD